MKKSQLRKIIRESIKELMNGKQLLTELYNCHCSPMGPNATCTVTCADPNDDSRSAGCPDHTFVDTGTGCGSFNAGEYCRSGCLGNILDPTAGVDLGKGGGTYMLPTRGKSSIR